MVSARALIAEHKFWDPRMRARLKTMLDAKQAGLHSLIFDAGVKLHP